MPDNKQLTDQDYEEARRYLTHIAEDREGSGRFSKGHTGNPKGRPKEPDGLVDMLMFRLNKETSKAIADRLIDLAKSGNLEAIKYLYDRVEGRPRQAVVQQQTAEPMLVALMRKLVNDNRALEGRPLIDQGSHVPAGPVIEGEVREVAGRSSRAGVHRERSSLGEE